jgi:hypothetical protein
MHNNKKPIEFFYESSIQLKSGIQPLSTKKGRKVDSEHFPGQTVPNIVVSGKIIKGMERAR